MKKKSEVLIETQAGEEITADAAKKILSDFKLPEHVAHISAARAEEFLAILVEIGIGEIINEVVKEKQSDDLIMKPVTAKMQMDAARKSRGAGKTVQQRILDVQLHIDYQELMQRCVKARVLSRMSAIVMDQGVDEVNIAEASRYIPFFLTHSSTILQGLTSLVVTSV